MIHEKLLHYIWQHKLFTAQALHTSDGQQIEVIDVGKLNTDAGPDFFNAKIKINNTLWVGNVEIHIRASDWQKHGHQHDKAYDSVVLHVVHQIDGTTLRSNGEQIPQAELQFPASIVDKYESLQANTQWIACASNLSEVDAFHIRAWITACLSERLSHKAEMIYALLRENANNWEEAFYITLARNFGFGVNSDAFEALAKSLPLSYLGKHKDNLFQLEALLFGQAGLLETDSSTADEYQSALLKEYRFLQAKFDLKPLHASRWKLLRLRPSNFPHIRLAQFAALVHQSSKLFSKMLENPSLEYLESLFVCRPSDYWRTHYLFGEESAAKDKKLGKSASEVILINTVIPFLFCYGQSKQNETLQESALALLEQLPAEKNSIITQWQAHGIEAQSAYDSQALLQWKRNYCEKKDCLRCAIGHKVLKSF